jgi:biotin synthase
MDFQNLKNKIYSGYKITKKEANALVDMPLEALCKAANEIREYFCKDIFDVCSVFNGKCGKCSENCKFCAQSKFYKTEITEYPMIEDKEKLITEAVYNQSKGILRFSIVTSGRGLNDDEIDIACSNYHAIAENCNIALCASHGLLSLEQLLKLKNAGVKRIHCNIETNKIFFPQICSSHTYDDRVNTIKLAQSTGLEICSGGIFGLGETWPDRIDLAFELHELEIKSIPINILRAIKGTPLESNKMLPLAEIRKIVAIFRFILPDAAIRMAAGRGLMVDKGRAIFLSGANACITGDMLTTAGVHVDEDIPMLKELGYKIEMF